MSMCTRALRLQKSRPQQSRAEDHPVSAGASATGVFSDTSLAQDLDPALHHADHQQWAGRGAYPLGQRLLFGDTHVRAGCRR
jgi:hypothetical protein